MTSGIRDTSVTVLAKILTILFGIGLQSCLAWALAPEGRGSYAVCNIYFSLLSVFSCFSIDVAIQYYMASKKMSLSEGVSASLWCTIFSSLLAISIGYVLMQMNFSFFNKASSEAFYFSLAYIPIFMLSTYFQYLFIGLGEFTLLAIFSIILAALQLIFVMIFVWLAGLGVNGALLGVIISGLIMIVGGFLYLHFKFNLTLHMLSLDHFRVLFQYGIRFYFARLSDIVNLQIGTIILAFYTSPTEIGFFSVGAKLMGYIFILPNVLSDVLMPRVTGDPVNRLYLVTQSMRLVGMLCGLIIIVVLLIGKPLVSIIFSPSFLPIVPLLYIFAPGIFIRCISKISIPYLKGTNHPGVISIAVVLGVLTNLILLYYLLPTMGLTGAAWAMTLGYFVSSIILLIKFYSLSNLSVSDIFLLKRSDLDVLIHIYTMIHAKVVKRIVS